MTERHSPPDSAACGHQAGMTRGIARGTSSCRVRPANVPPAHRHAESVLPMCPRHIVMPDLIRHLPCTFFRRWSGSLASRSSREHRTARSTPA